MRRFACFSLLCLCLALPLSIRSVSAEEGLLNARTAEAFGKLPLSFVENCGQLDEQVRYVIRGPRASAFFRNDGVTFDLWDASPSDNHSSDPAYADIDRKSSQPEVRTHAVLKVTFQGADPNSRVEGIDELSGKVNYFTSKDSSKWRTDVSTFRGVAYRDIWPGVDLLYHGDRRQLKYDIRIDPGADVKSIRLKYEGGESIRLDKAGDLHIKTAVTEFVETVPGIYQEKDGEKIPVKGGYVLLDAQTVGFQVKDYDSALPLVIDPASNLVYSTLLGGSVWEHGYGIAVDSAGCAYVVGETASSDFPTAPGSFQTTYGGSYSDAFITKLNPSGSAVVYSTFLGGSGEDGACCITLDSSGCAHVAGTSDSLDFPVTPGAFQTILNHDSGFWDAFIVKLNPSGNALLFSTFLGGSGGDTVNAIALDPSGYVYLAGDTDSPDLPITIGAFQTHSCGGTGDAFAAKLNPLGSAITYCTYLCGTGGDSILDMAVDSSGCAYVTGSTDSLDFPTTPGAFRTSQSIFGSAFVTKIDSSGSALVYSTLLGGSGSDSANGIAIDSAGCAYVAGVTTSSNFPTTEDSFQTSPAGNSEIFVSKLNSSGSALVYSTFLGGGNLEGAYDIAVDASGSAYVTGITNSSDFPVTPGAFQPTIAGSNDAFIARVNAAGTGLIYASLFGGSGRDSGKSVAVDSNGYAYVAGETYSGVPTTSGAFQSDFGGATDAFVIKVGMNGMPTNESLSPNRGTVSPSTKAAFVSSYWDGDGYADLSNCFLLLNTRTGVSSNSVYLFYSPVQNKLYLRNDANTAWTGGCAPGSSNVLENSQCKIYCAETTVSGTGNRLTVSWKIEFKPSMTSKTVLEWMYVTDKAGRTDGWDRMGTITVGNSPVNVSLSPAGGTMDLGAKTTLTCQYSDADGVEDIAYAYLLANKTYGSGANSIYAVYNQKVNLLYLKNDANTGWMGGFAPGSNNTIENAECKIFCAETTVTKSGNTLTVNWKLLPKSAMLNGTWIEWLMVTDKANLTDGWDKVGTVTVQ